MAATRPRSMVVLCAGLLIAVMTSIAPANAVDPQDVPAFTCEELLGKDVAQSELAYFEEWKERTLQDYVKSGYSQQDIDSLSARQYQTITSYPPATSCIWGSLGLSPFTSVELDNPENRSEFERFFSPTEENGVMIDITSTQVGEYTLLVKNNVFDVGQVFGVIRNGFIFEGTNEENVASAIKNVEARMAELNTPPATNEAQPTDQNSTDQNKVVEITSIATPSVLSSLRTLFDINLTLGAIGTTVGGAVVLTILLAFPTTLLQQVINRRYSLFARRISTLSRWFNQTNMAVTQLVKPIPQWVRLSVGLLLATVITGFVSPTFGVNPQSLRVLLSIFWALIFESVVLLLITTIWVAYKGGVSRINFKFGSLLILLCTVLFTRFTGFEPGLVFGLILGLVLVVSSTKATQTNIFVVETVLAMILGVIAWVAYSLIYIEVAELSPEVSWLRETFSAITLGTLTALPLTLLPLGNLPGRIIFQTRKFVWTALIFFALILFFGIVMPFPESVQEVTWPLAAWLTFFGLYALFAVLVWSVDQFISRGNRAKSVSSS